MSKYSEFKCRISMLIVGRQNSPTNDLFFLSIRRGNNTYMGPDTTPFCSRRCDLFRRFSCHLVQLSYAISMLGKSRIVLLDEPSTGMDPQSKRFLWDTICSTFPQGGDRGALLTTHSMEEADALCTKVGIMVRGALR